MRNGIQIPAFAGMTEGWAGMTEGGGHYGHLMDSRFRGNDGGWAGVAAGVAGVAAGRRPSAWAGVVVHDELRGGVSPAPLLPYL